MMSRCPYSSANNNNSGGHGEGDGQPGHVEAEVLEELTRMRLAGGGGGCPFDDGPMRRASRLTDCGEEEEEGEGGGGGKKRRASKPMDPLYYGDYLQLGKILNAQELESEKAGNRVHDEHLFIVIHQTYELWFKQILVEIDSVRGMFNQSVRETDMLCIVTRLQRVIEILKVCVGQVGILETMTPMDFMDFRDYLYPASGFQSRQFRQLENVLGLRKESRVRYQSKEYVETFNERDAAVLRDGEKNEISLLRKVEGWLERTPGLERDGFDFWAKYTAVVRAHLDGERTRIDSVKRSYPEEHANLLNEHEKSVQTFESVLDEKMHDELVRRGDRRLSHRAMQGALMIAMYRENPMFHLAYQFLNNLMEIDSQLTKWRHQHVLMVQRMIGSKLGTGGSSGYHYLRSTLSDRYKVFVDLFNLPTYLLPRTLIPQLPPQGLFPPGKRGGQRGSIYDLAKISDEE